MAATPIQWTDFSLNPIRARHGDRVGHYCEKISTGCKHCYSSTMQRRFGLPTFQENPKLHTKPESFLDAKTLLEPLKRRKPTKWFWCDMSDMFGDWVPFEWVAACFGVMAATPQHTHQVLTKRPERAREFFQWVTHDRGFDHAQSGKLHIALCDAMQAIKGEWDPSDRFCEELLSNANEWPLENVWLGVSSENQETWKSRVPTLVHGCPAAVHFVSAEPLLGPIDIGSTGRLHVDWLIVGGESSRAARECELAWIRSLRDQCREAEIACFVKQLGRLPMGEDGALLPLTLDPGHGGDWLEWPEDLRVRDFPRPAKGGTV